MLPEWKDLVADLEMTHTPIASARVSRDRICLSDGRQWPCLPFRAAQAIEHLATGHDLTIQWAGAYPVEQLAEPSRADWGRAAQLLKIHGLRLEALSASNFRHVLTRAAEISTEALKLRAG